MKYALALAILAGSANADVIAYWNQNSNDLGVNGTGTTIFGYTTSDFPMAADVGSGSWGIANFDATTESAGTDPDVTKYAFVESFSGTTVGALFGDSSGGSFAFEGDVNNGAQVVLSFDATGYESINLDFSRRGTSTGYNFVDVSYRNVTGGLTSVGTINAAGTSAWVAYNFDFGSALDGNATAEIVITFDGASSGSGNNRLDNVAINGTLVPAPGAFALLGLGGLVATRRRR